MPCWTPSIKTVHSVAGHLHRNQPKHTCHTLENTLQHPGCSPVKTECYENICCVTVAFSVCRVGFPESSRVIILTHVQTNVQTRTCSMPGGVI